MCSSFHYNYNVALIFSISCCALCGGIDRSDLEISNTQLLALPPSNEPWVGHITCPASPWISLWAELEENRPFPYALTLGPSEIIAWCLSHHNNTIEMYNLPVSKKYTAYFRDVLKNYGKQDQIMSSSEWEKLDTHNETHTSEIFRAEFEKMDHSFSEGLKGQGIQPQYSALIYPSFFNLSTTSSALPPSSQKASMTLMIRDVCPDRLSCDCMPIMRRVMHINCKEV